jgi:hypothetical protein
VPKNILVNYIFVQAKFANFSFDGESITDAHTKEIQASSEEK